MFSAELCRDISTILHPASPPGHGPGDILVMKTQFCSNLEVQQALRVSHGAHPSGSTPFLVPGTGRGRLMSCRVSAGRLVAPADMAGLAEEVVVQGVAPVLCQLQRQGHPAALRAKGEKEATF